VWSLIIPTAKAIHAAKKRESTIIRRFILGAYNIFIINFSRLHYIRFVPLSPARKAGHVMAWKKNRVFGRATSMFLEYAKNTFQA
jgi:hypothetical protein